MFEQRGPGRDPLDQSTALMRMNEALDKVRDVDELPLFPLSVVLFPGTPLPLHIFEARYRKMLVDVRAGNMLFGLSYFDSSFAALGRPPIGHLGCVAEVRDVQELPDGRFNIMTTGLIRYRLESYRDSDEPYLVGHANFFEDEPEDESLLGPAALEVFELFKRVARAIRRINDDRKELPELPIAQPELLSFVVCAALDLDDDVKLELLEMRATSTRLLRLKEFLSRSVNEYEYRAQVHGAAKTNGHGAKKITIE